MSLIFFKTGPVIRKEISGEDKLDQCPIQVEHCLRHGKNTYIYLLNIGSIRIYILMTGVVSNETNTHMYVCTLKNLF